MIRTCIATVFLFGSLAPVAALAGKAPQLSAVLQGLKWGDSVEAVQTALKKRIETRYAKLLEETSEALEQRELRGRLNREVQDLLAGYTKFDGQKTAFEVGVVGEEFKHGTGESVLMVRENKADRYFFFIGGKLWKLFVSYSADTIKDVKFADFVEKTRKKYGRPFKIEKAGQGNDRVATRAEWRDRQTLLEARDRTAFFQTYTLSFSHRPVRERIEDLRGKPATGRTSDPADALIEAATKEKPLSAEDKKATKKKPQSIDIY
jgi:hypothetical protein